MTPRARRAAALLGLALLAGGLVAGALVVARPALEERLRERIGREARARGLAATVGAVRLHLTSLDLREIVLDRPEGLRLLCREVRVRPRLSPLGLLGRAASVEHGPLVVELPAGVRLGVAPSRWVAEAGWREGRLRLDAPGETLELVRRRERGVARLVGRARDARLSGRVDLRRRGCPLADPGTLDGELLLEREGGGPVRAELHLAARGFALAALGGGPGEACPDTPAGAPTDVTGEATGSADPAAGALRVEHFHVSAAGVLAEGRLAVEGGAARPEVDLEVEVKRLELAPLLATAGLEQPAGDLGSASLALRVRGPLADPSALAVEQRLEFRPPERPLPAIERLKAPFVHEATAFDGRKVTVAVSLDSPDFIALDDVPPLFVRTLLLGEDAGFWGHAGLDLRELPGAIATNLAQGRFVRGASTISQQLAKNLFLSRERSLGRKLTEASLALLLDAALGKRRVLEIYLNVIEWGPGLYGLRPAARHYFGLEPGGLAPKQMSFLVAMVPGPVTYQRSIEGGTPTPFFEGRMASLLAKLRSVGALTDEEHAAALAGPLGLLATAAEPEAPPEAEPEPVERPLP